jgi:transposase InsO family protein
MLRKEVGRVLMELSKVEQRYDAVLAVIRDGLTISEAAIAYGVSRQTIYRWMQRYEEGGLAALAERSHRPKACPHQIDPRVEGRIVTLRQGHPSWGPIRIQHQLGREGFKEVPSHMAIYRALVRHHLIEPKNKRKRLRTYKRWERSRPMELWQMDIVGGVLLDDGTECKVLTGVDDHSRFCVCAGIMVRATARPVCAFFAQALERHGVPEEILTDNGKVFTARFGLRPAEVLFDKICRENGITHRLTAPASPTTTGKIERFHRTFRQDFLGGQIFSTLKVAQKELDAWVHDYNTERPHQSIGRVAPIERFSVRDEPTPALPADTRGIAEDRSGEDWISRYVTVNGVSSVANQAFSVGKHRAGHVVDIRVHPTFLEIWDGSELVKTVMRTSKGVVRKKKAEKH